MSKLPSFQFYPGDWLKDPALAICSAGARGVWLDVLCLMFESPNRGYLITNGKPWTIEQIAIALRGDWQENLVYLKELVANGVMKRVEARKSGRKVPKFLGAFYSDRLRTDEVRREEWREQKRRQLIENKRRHSGMVSGLSSSSSSSSSSNLNTKTPLPPAGAGDSRSHDELLKDKNYAYMRWGGDVIIIRTGNHRRILTQSQESALQGANTQRVLEKLRHMGFWAEIYKSSEKSEAAQA